MYLIKFYALPLGAHQLTILFYNLCRNVLYRNIIYYSSHNFSLRLNCYLFFLCFRTLTLTMGVSAKYIMSMPLIMLLKWYHHTLPCKSSAMNFHWTSSCTCDYDDLHGIYHNIDGKTKSWLGCYVQCPLSLSKWVRKFQWLFVDLIIKSVVF